MGKRTKSKLKYTTSTPDPRRQFMNRKMLFTDQLSPIQEFSSQIVKKPSMMQLVIDAIKSVGSIKKGANFPAIKKWIIANSEPATRNQSAAIKKAIDKGLKSGTLIRPSHSKDANGISGWFMLAPTAKKINHSSSQEVPNKEILHSSKANLEMSSKTNIKDLSTAKSIKKVKKKGSKNALSPQKEIVKKDLKKKQTLSPKAGDKKKTKRNLLSLETSNKGAKKNIESLEVTTKKVLKNKYPFQPEGTINLISSSDSDSDSNSDSENDKSEQEPELTKQMANKSKASKQDKSNKSKEPKVKTIPKSAVNKIENSAKELIQKKRLKENESDVKKIAKQLKTNRRKFNENNTAAHNGNKMYDSKHNKITRTQENALDTSQKDMSDTEINTRPNRSKRKYSCASDTELEISKRSAFQTRKRVKRKKRSRKHAVSE